MCHRERTLRFKKPTPGLPPSCPACGSGCFFQLLLQYCACHTWHRAPCHDDNGQSFRNCKPVPNYRLPLIRLFWPQCLFTATKQRLWQTVSRRNICGDLTRGPKVRGRWGHEDTLKPAVAPYWRIAATTTCPSNLNQNESSPDDQWQTNEQGECDMESQWNFI